MIDVTVNQEQMLPHKELLWLCYVHSEDVVEPDITGMYAGCQRG